MNRICPICDADLLETEEDSPPVPFEENDRIGTLHFCSEGCCDEYKDA